MFEDSLLESGGRFKKQRNPWATALSFTIEIAVVALLVLVPMIYTEALPVKGLEVFIMPTAPTRSADPAPEHTAAVHDPKPTASNFTDGVLVVPPSMPIHAAHIVDDPQDFQVGPVGNTRDNCPGCIPTTGTGANNQAVTDVLRSVPKPIMPTIKPPQPVSGGVMEGLLIRKVTPVYPALARAARVQGTVTLAATISREGTIQNLTVTSGHPMLARAAVDAVQQWRYRPYLLNNQPVDVETTVTVNFTLN
jgi:protein TonB